MNSKAAMKLLPDKKLKKAREVAAKQKKTEEKKTKEKLRNGNKKKEREK